MSKRKRKAGAVNGVEKGAPMLQASKSRKHKQSYTNDNNKPQQLTERERMLLKMYAECWEMWMKYEKWCNDAKGELTTVRRFLSVLGLMRMYDEFAKQSTEDDEMEYCKKGVSAIVSKIALMG